MQSFLKYIFLCILRTVVNILHMLIISWSSHFNIVFLHDGVSWDPSHSGNRSSHTSPTSTGRQDPKAIVSLYQGAPIKQKLPSGLWAGCAPAPQSFYRVQKQMAFVCIYFPTSSSSWTMTIHASFLQSSHHLRQYSVYLLFPTHEKINWKRCPSWSIIHFIFTCKYVLQKHILYHVYHCFSWVRISLPFCSVPTSGTAQPSHAALPQQTRNIPGISFPLFTLVSIERT